MTSILHCHWRKFWSRGTNVHLRYIRFGIILTQFYVNFLRQEHQIDCLICIVQLMRLSGFSLYPFHFSFTVPLKDNVLNQVFNFLIEENLKFPRQSILYLFWIDIFNLRSLVFDLISLNIWPNILNFWFDIFNIRLDTFILKIFNIILISLVFDLISWIKDLYSIWLDIFRCLTWYFK